MINANNVTIVDMHTADTIRPYIQFLVKRPQRAHAHVSK